VLTGDEEVELIAVIPVGRGERYEHHRHSPADEEDDPTHVRNLKDGGAPARAEGARGEEGN